MRTPRAVTVTAAACVAAVGAPVLLGSFSSAAGDAASFVIRMVTSLLAVVLLLRRTPRGSDGPLASSRLFAAALLMGALAALIALVAAAVGLGSKELADLVYLCHVPLAAVGLMLLPVEEVGGRARFRALLDGALAATSLSLVIRLAVPGLGVGTGRLTQVDLLAICDVFLVAIMLGLLPRVRPQLRRYLVLTSCGLALIGAANLQKAIALGEGWPVSSHGLRTAVIEIGLLLVVAGAAQPLRVGGHPPGWRWPALAPYVPVLVAVAFLVVVIATERRLHTTERALAALCFIALLIRQAVASWDSAELLERLRAREGAYRRQALEDSLTGLPNRRSFLAALEDLSASAAPVTLLLVDCDGFKRVNDTQGHEAGDAVLRHVGAQMAAAVDGLGTVARLGGDEFAVLLHVGVQEALLVAQQLRAAAQVPLSVNSRSTSLSVSVGGVAAESGGDAHALLAHADVALYRAKAGEGAGLVLLDRAGRADAARQLQLREDIARPRLSQFSVVYQPLFDGRCGQLRGAEALLRWEHPVLGPVSPAVFIPLAEQTGAIEALGAFVLQEALAQLARWRDAFPHHRLAVGVNVSPQQLGDDVFAELVLDLLRKHGLDPSQLVVELTEQAFISDLGQIAAMAKLLREAGVSVAVDDFGTGYASLRYLESIPTDVLKIDRSYVSAMSTSPGAHALVRGVLALARELDLQCVAEGVETVEQQVLLSELGCEVLQGYLLGRPGPPEAIAALMAPPVVPPQRVSGAAVAAVPS